MAGEGQVDLTTLPRLYGLTDARGERRLTPLESARLLLEAGVKLVQLRDKSPSAGARLAAARLCLELPRKEDVRLLVNDRCDVARLAEAHGVHLGEEDLSAAFARSFLGADAVIGVSSHSVEAAFDAMEDAAPSYVALGPIFESRTKPSVRFPLGLGTIREVARRKKKPLVVIGGITPDRVGDCLSAGADSVAMIAGLLDGDVRANVERARASAAQAGFAT